MWSPWRGSNVASYPSLTFGKPYWLKKDVTKYTHHSLSNVSHLPTVDQRIERWIKIHQCQKIIQQMPSQDRFTRDSKSSSHAKVWHITSQKHDIHIKCSKCSFFRPCVTCQFSILCYLLYLQSAINFILWRRTTVCILQQSAPAIIRQTDPMIPITEEKTFAEKSSVSC